MMAFENLKHISSPLNSIILILSIMIISPIFSTGTSFSQSENIDVDDNTTELTKSISVQIGKPIFVEKYSILNKAPIVMSGLNATKFVLTGNGTINAINSNGTINAISVENYGQGVSIPQSNNTQSIIGRAFLSTESEDGGHASYFFQAIGYSEGGLQKSKGAVFFTSNATGSLSLLNDMMGIYKTELNKSDGLGNFTMWEWK